MRTQLEQKPLTALKLKDSEQESVDSHQNSLFLEETHTYSGILGKRLSNDQTLDQLRAETEDSVDLEDGPDSSEKRERRLQQNRKSAKKCRLKKKAEFGQMRGDVTGLVDENKILKEKINEMTIMLYQKMEENSTLQRKFEQAQLQQLLFISQMSSAQNPPQQAPAPTLMGSNNHSVLPPNILQLLGYNGTSNLGCNLSNTGFGQMGNPSYQQLMSLLSGNAPTNSSVSGAMESLSKSVIPLQQVKESHSSAFISANTLNAPTSLKFSMVNPASSNLKAPKLTGPSEMSNSDLIEILKHLNQRKASDEVHQQLTHVINSTQSSDHRLSI